MFLEACENTMSVMKGYTAYNRQGISNFHRKFLVLRVGLVGFDITLERTRSQTNPGMQGRMYSDTEKDDLYSVVPIHSPSSLLQPLTALPASSFAGRVASVEIVCSLSMSIIIVSAVQLQ